MTKTKIKKKAKEDYLAEKLDLIKTEEYSVEEYNNAIKEIESLKNLENYQELPFRAERFCQEYVTHYNEEKAAQKAGWPIWNAAVAGKRLLAEIRVQNRIEELQKNISVKLKITRERILEEYAKIAYSNLQDLYNDDGTLKDISKIDRDIAASLSGVEFGQRKNVKDDGTVEYIPFIKKVEQINKKSALDALSKHLGLFDKDSDRQLPVDLKTLIGMFPPETQEAIKLSFAKRIGNKHGKR